MAKGKPNKPAGPARSAPTIGDILAGQIESAHLDPRIILMAEQDQNASRIATELKGAVEKLGRDLGLEVVNFGIKKPSRTGMIKVVIQNEPGQNLHPRSREFRQFIKLFRPHNLWLAWVAVKEQSAKPKSKPRR